MITYVASCKNVDTEHISKILTKIEIILFSRTFDWEIQSLVLNYSQPVWTSLSECMGTQLYKDMKLPLASLPLLQRGTGVPVLREQVLQ